MTTRHVYSGASGAANGTSETDAYTTLGAAITASSAGDIIRVRGNSGGAHNETANAAITYTLPTTQPGLKILSVTFNGSGTGGLESGATVNVGAANAGLTISGFGYWYGLTLNSGTNNNNQCATLVGTFGRNQLIFEKCTFGLPTANTSTWLRFGANGTNSFGDIYIKLIDCTRNYTPNMLVLIQSGRIEIDNLILAGTAPTTVFGVISDANAVYVDAVIRNSDLSGVAWTNLVNVATQASGKFVSQNCKLRSGFTLTTGTFPSVGGTEVHVIDCDSGDNHYKYTKVSYAGTVSTDSGKYAAGSGNGTDNFSLLMVTNANASFVTPLIAPDIIYFNDTLSAMATTVPVAHNGVGGGTGGKLLNSDMWQETSAKVTSGVPLATWNIADRVADILTAGVDQDTDGTTSWTGSSIATHDKLVSGSFTPAEVGDIVVSVKLAKASVSVYASPLVI